MSKKWKVFGYQTKLNWFDVKTKFKSTLREVAYTKLVTEIVCSIFQAYMWLVYLTCRKKFVNHYQIFEAARNKKPLIIAFWHNRLMMIPFITLGPKKAHRGYNFMTLASRHGDGRFVGRVMEKFGLISILGSTKNSKHKDRGIPISSLKQIFGGLKKGYSLGITPDGPRGPNQKINGEIVNIARISGALIIPTSYSCSRSLELRTWDKFKIPLPFSKLCFYFDEELFGVAKNADADEMEKIKDAVEKRIDLIQEKSLREVK